MVRLLAATAISTLLPLRSGATGPFGSFTLEEIMADPAKEAELSAAVGEALQARGATLDGRRELQASADWDAGLRELLPAPPSTMSWWKRPSARSCASARSTRCCSGGGSGARSCTKPR